ncbi:MAG TPA: hypothetical protein VLD62_09660, partial [Acidimicrobiia bacterium]|nr:hypothetical protein [Acidimicrobiia bacterium]
ASAAALVRSLLPSGHGLDDLGEHRLKDLGEPERLHQLTGPGLIADFGPVRSLERRPNNLPVQLTSFVGREHALAEVIELIGENRIVTLTGVGGVGKTRLAIQAAAESIDVFRDGVWLVELAPLSETGFVLPAIAAAAGITEEPSRPLIETVSRELAGRVLLVIDNCEHLIDEVAKTVDELLRACPDLRVVATSREGLAVGGERLWRCPSMDSHGDAVDLFLERAELVGGVHFDGDASRPAIERICERLDGIPLAIELATARLKVFTPEQLAVRLDDRFRLLTGGARTAMPRQRTLQAAMDWSHDLLPDHERILLRRLGVFHGGFTMESAERVCSDDVVSEFEVLDLLIHLVDASLVAFDSHGRSPRYRLLETVRQYAMDRLFEATEADAFRRRHAEEFEMIMRDAEAGLLGPDADAWADRCRSEADNVRAALTWAFEAGEHELALRIAGSFGRYWSYAGMVVEARDRLLVIALREHEDSSALAEAIGWLSHFVHLEGKTEEAAGYADRSLEIARRVGEPHTLLRSLMVKANSLNALGEADEALDAYVEIADRAREIGDDYLQIALFNVAMSAPGRGRHDESRAAAAEMVELAEASGQDLAKAMARSIAAVSAFFRGDVEDARVHAEIGEQHLVPGFPQPLAGISMTKANLAALVDDDLVEAEAQVRRSLAATEQLGETDFTILAHRLLSEIALMRGEIDTALDHFEISVEVLLGRTDRPDDAAFLGSTLAAIAVRLDQLPLAMTAVELDRLRRLERDIRLPVPYEEITDQRYAEIEEALAVADAEAAKARAAALAGREVLTLLEELRATR